MKSFLNVIVALIFITGCASSGLKRQPQQSADIGTVTQPSLFKDLKTFRSYFQIQLESKMSEQFEVWYEEDGGRWSVFHMAVKADEKFTTIPDDRLLSTHMIYAVRPEPQATVAKLPKSLEGVAQRIKNAVPATFAKTKIKNIQVVYLGQWARVLAYQHVPRNFYDATNPPDYQPGRTAERYFFVNTKTNQIKPFGGGTSDDSVMTEPYNKVLPTSWVHVALPKEAEGNPVLGLDAFRATEWEPSQIPPCLLTSLEKSEKLLLKAIVKRAREMETGKGLSSQAILAQNLLTQGNDPLPPGLEQRVNIDGYIFNYTESGIGDLPQIRFQILAPVKKNQKINHVDAKSGIDLTFELNLSAKQLSMIATRDGNTVQGTTVLDDKFIKTIDFNGQTVLLSDVYFEPFSELQLPGSGDVSTYNIYPNSITLSPFSIPAGNSCQEKKKSAGL